MCHQVQSRVFPDPVREIRDHQPDACAAAELTLQGLLHHRVARAAYVLFQIEKRSRCEIAI